MNAGKRFNMAYRRQREGRTNYKARLSLLKSGKPRIVIRRTNSRVIMQLAKYQQKGDKILITVSSAELEKLGWGASKKSMPACYLTGLLMGTKMLDKGEKHAIADIGLQSASHKGDIYACLKGIVDSGVDMPVNGEHFPDEARIQGKHISQYAANASGQQFSKTKKEAIALPALFEKTKAAIAGLAGAPAAKKKTHKEEQ